MLTDFVVPESKIIIVGSWCMLWMFYGLRRVLGFG